MSPAAKQAVVEPLCVYVSKSVVVADATPEHQLSLAIRVEIVPLLLGQHLAITTKQIAGAFSSALSGRAT